MREPARALAILQIAAIVLVGAVTVARFHIFAPVDERAHLDYVQEVAEGGRLPWFGREYVSWQELAIEEHTYPRPSSLNPRLLGLRGSGYEAWQPPLYYALAAPAFLLVHDYREKIFAVRAFDLLLLLAAVAILALLAQAVFERGWWGPYCLALSTILWPGVIVRAITVSNVALELPLVPLYVLVLWHATARPSARWMLAAGGLLGLCVLTQLTLVCLAPMMAVPLAAQLRERRDRPALGAATFALVLPLVLAAPWLALNESRYGALTASSQVKRLIAPYAPTGPDLATITAGLWRFTRAALPQEWWGQYNATGGAVLVALPALFVFAALPAMRHPRLLRSRAAALLGAPLPLGFLTLLGIALLAGWPDSLFPRYVNPMLPLFALFTAWIWTRGRMGGRVLLAPAALAALAVSLIWIYMAGAYYFTNVGAELGIHAAQRAQRLLYATSTLQRHTAAET